MGHGDIVSRASNLGHLMVHPFVSHEIDKHAVLQVHAEASKPY